MGMTEKKRRGGSRNDKEKRLETLRTEERGSLIVVLGFWKRESGRGKILSDVVWFCLVRQYYSCSFHMI